MAGPYISVNPAVLANVPLFAMLNGGQLQTLATVMTRRSFAKARAVLNAGDATDSLYIILAGRVKVQREDDEGKEVILSVLGPGEYFGEMGLLDESPRSASVVTLEPCEFTTMTKESFIDFMGKNADMAMVIMRGLVKRLRDADRKIETLALLDVYGRVARVLLEFAEEIQGRKVVKNKLPRQDIAKMIGASREMVSRVMKGLETEGYIEVDEEGTIILKELISTYL